MRIDRSDCPQSFRSPTGARIGGPHRVVEEGSSSAGFGAEALARIEELAGDRIVAARLGSYPVPPPSVPALEAEVLPTLARLVAVIALVLGK